MVRSKIVLTSILLFLSVGLVFAQKIRFDYDHNADFSKYKTFMWIKEPETAKDPLMKKRIVDAVNMQLEAKGLQLSTNADLAVAVNVASKEKQTLDRFYDGFGGWVWGIGGVTTTTVETYNEGTMVVDLFDTKTKKIVWRGVATKEEVSSKPTKATKEIETAIEKLFKHYPPIQA